MKYLILVMFLIWSCKTEDSSVEYIKSQLIIPNDTLFIVYGKAAYLNMDSIQFFKSEVLDYKLGDQPYFKVKMPFFDTLKVKGPIIDTILVNLNQTNINQMEESFDSSELDDIEEQFRNNSDSCRIFIVESPYSIEIVESSIFSRLPFYHCPDSTSKIKYATPTHVFSNQSEYIEIGKNKKEKNRIIVEAWRNKDDSSLKFRVYNKFDQDTLITIFF